MRASFYESDITPPLGGFMWGYYSKQIAQDVVDRLYARAVVLKQEETVAAFVTVDTCVIPPEMHGIVTDRIQEYTGIRPEAVCISSNTFLHEGFASAYCLILFFGISLLFQGTYSRTVSLPPGIVFWGEAG